ncbi:MAG: hypothetical protein AAFR68_08355 [Pseudomonadota bacterium]
MEHEISFLQQGRIIQPLDTICPYIEHFIVDDADHVIMADVTEVRLGNRGWISRYVRNPFGDHVIVGGDPAIEKIEGFVQVKLKDRFDVLPKYGPRPAIIGLR